MRILITNDDGINAPGLTVLRDIATELAGPDGEVWTVAPAFEQSGVGHCINYARPTLISEFAPRVYACEGSPADCVLAGLRHVLTDNPPDLVLSGVNRGNNAAENTLYSGTVGAVIEAALQGARAIALSQFYGPENATADDPFEAARSHGAALVRRLVEQAPWDATPYAMFYSVNFPPVPAAAVKGSQIVPQGMRPGTAFGVEPFAAPNGRQFLWIKGGPQHVPSAPGTDAAVNLDGWISVTPMRADLTDHAAVAALAADWD